MTKVGSLRPGKEGFDKLIKMLASKDPETHRIAANTLVAAPQYANRDVILLALVLAASKPRRRIKHRIRILEVVEEIGYPLGPAIFELFPLMGHHSPELRAKAFKLVTGVSTLDPLSDKIKALAKLKLSPVDPSLDSAVKYQRMARKKSS